MIIEIFDKEYTLFKTSKRILGVVTCSEKGIKALKKCLPENVKHRYIVFTELETFLMGLSESLPARINKWSVIGVFYETDVKPEGVKDFLEISEILPNTTALYKKIQSKVVSVDREVAGLFGRFEFLAEDFVEFLLFLTLLTIAFHNRRYILSPSDMYSQFVNLLPLSQNHQKLGPNLFKFGKIEVFIDLPSIKNQKTSLDAVDRFLNELSPRLGDVYNFLFQKCLTSGFTKSNTKSVHVTAKEIARALEGENFSRYTLQRVAEALADLEVLRLRIPLPTLPEKLRKAFIAEADSRGYLSVTPFVFFLSVSKDRISEKRTRIHEAIVSFHPLFWRLYFEYNFRVPIPIPLKNLDIRYRPQRWAKAIGLVLIYHSRENQKVGKEQKIRVLTVLERADILKEIEAMRKNRNTKRAYSYLIKAFEILNELEDFSIKLPQASNLMELLNTSITYEYTPTKIESLWPEFS